MLRASTRNANINPGERTEIISIFLPSLCFHINFWFRIKTQSTNDPSFLLKMKIWKIVSERKKNNNETNRTFRTLAVQTFTFRDYLFIIKITSIIHSSPIFKSRQNCHDKQNIIIQKQQQQQKSFNMWAIHSLCVRRHTHNKRKNARDGIVFSKNKKTLFTL